jgi:GNAT superfamily N-acetyltransferase
MPTIDLRMIELPASDTETLVKIGELRVRAWSTLIPQAESMGTWLDEFEASSRHWVVYRGYELIAAARMSVHQHIEEVPDPECYVGVFGEPVPAPIASFNRLVVDPSARGLRISRRLDLVRLDAAEGMGCRCAIGSISSGEHRLRQMAELGFTVVGPGNPDPRPPCCYGPRSMMVVYCPLPRTCTFACAGIPN